MRLSQLRFRIGQAFPPYMVSAKTGQARGMKISCATVSHSERIAIIGEFFQVESLTQALALPFRCTCDPCTAKALAIAFGEARLFGATKGANAPTWF